MSSKNDTSPSYPPLAAPTLLQSLRILSSHVFSSSSPDPTLTPAPVRSVVRTPTSELSKPCTSLRAMWAGHASMILDFPTDDPDRPFRLVTDPLFSKGCGPISWPRRTVGVPFEAKDLGWVDAVVISHDHYDHLDHRSIKQIESLNSNTKYFGPLGVGSWFTKRGIPKERIIELDWWGSATLGVLTTSFEVLTKDTVRSKKESGRLRTLLSRLKRKKGGEVGDEPDRGHVGAKKGLDVELDTDITSPVVPTLSTTGTKMSAKVELDSPLERSDYTSITDPTPKVCKIGEVIEDDLAITSVDSVTVDLANPKKDDQKTILESAGPFITVTCLPAHHNTGRNLCFIDKDRSKPATWLFQVLGTKEDPGGKTVFFGGDSGYQGADGKKTRLYQDIRDRYGPVDLALLPIASGSLSSRFHLPDELVQHLHAMPLDAVEQFITLTGEDSTNSEGKRRPRVGMAMHHTTLDSASGAKRTMRNLTAALRGSQVKSGWVDGGLATVDAGEWKTSDELNK